jgi:hypothetical protein
MLIEMFSLCLDLIRSCLYPAMPHEELCKALTRHSGRAVEETLDGWFFWLHYAGSYSLMPVSGKMFGKHQKFERSMVNHRMINMS